MPIVNVDFWNGDAGTTTRCLLLPTNDWHRQAWNLPGDTAEGGLYLDGDWADPAFDDSGWSAPVNPGGSTLNEAFGPFTAPDTVPGYWSHDSPDPNAESTVFRFYFDVPAGRVLSATLSLWYQSFLIWEFNSINELTINFGPPDPDHLVNDMALFTMAAFNNQFFGTQWTAAIVPGATNVVGIIGNHPFPHSCFDFAGCSRAMEMAGPPFMGWRIRVQMSLPVTEDPPIEGQAFVSPFQGARPNGARGLIPGVGPQEVLHGLGWDATPSGLTTETLSIGAWASQSPSEPFPPSVGLTERQSYVMYDGSDAPEFQRLRLAQGFQAQWAALEFVRLGLFTTDNINPVLTWPPGVSVVCEIYDDDSGFIGPTLLGAASVDLATLAASTSGPVSFQFAPTITLITDANYWIVIRFTGPIPSSATGPFMTVWSYFFLCNQNPATDGTVQVIYGFPSQGYQSMIMDGLGNWSMVGPTTGFPACDISVTSPDQAAVWDISIGGDGLSVPLKDRVMSSPIDGMGVGGRRDPNTDTWASTSVVSSWNVDGPLIQSAAPTFSEPYQFVTMIGAYVDTAGTMQAIAYAEDEDHKPAWGPVSAARSMGLTSFPWPYQTDPASPYVDRRLDVQGSSAVIQPNNRLVAMFQATNNGHTVASVIVQTLGDDSVYTDAQLLMPNPLSTRMETLQAINDAVGNTHLFFIDRAPLGPPHAGPIPGAPLYHCMVLPDGSISSPTTWDCAGAVFRGAGCLHTPTGGVIYPYQNKGNCFLAAIFHSDGSGPDFQELPTVFEFPPLRVIPRSPYCTLFVGDTGYIFAQDLTGISVARGNVDGWSGFAQWLVYPDISPLGSALAESAIVASYIASRDQISVLYQINGYVLFNWFTDTLSYPDFVPTGCQPTPCQNLYGFTQVIG